ncbi:hypothetical protein ACTA71_006119 [Dictyostelium dimigraforme]
MKERECRRNRDSYRKESRKSNRDHSDSTSPKDGREKPSCQKRKEAITTATAYKTIATTTATAYKTIPHTTTANNSIRNNTTITTQQHHTIKTAKRLVSPRSGKKIANNTEITIQRLAIIATYKNDTTITTAHNPTVSPKGGKKITNNNNNNCSNMSVTIVVVIQTYQMRTPFHLQTQ